MADEEEDNFFRLAYIVVNIVSETLRTIFKTEWDEKYPNMKWSDDTTSLNNFIQKAGTPPPKSKNYEASKYMQSSGGKREAWDVTVSSYALHSKALDIQNWKPTVFARVKCLVDIRNEVMHSRKWSKTDAEFIKLYRGIEYNLKNLSAINPVYTTLYNQTVAVRNRTKQPSVEEFMKVKQALEKEQKQIWRSASFVFGIVIVLIAIFKSIRALQSIPDFPERLIPDFFQGRKSLTKDTVNAILGGTIFTMFSGPPGIGKTTASLVVARELRDKYSFVVSFVEVRGIVDVSTVSEKIYKSFYGEYREYSEEAFDDLFRRRLTDKTLLIIDNAEDILTPEMIKETKRLLLRIVKYNKNIHIILTSRKKIESIGDTDVFVKRLDILDQQTSILVMTSSSMCPILSHELLIDTANEIAKRCSGVPLLLSIAGKQLKRQTRHVEEISKQQKIVENFLEELRKESVLVTLNEDDEIDERSLMHCINVLFSRLRQDLQTTFIGLAVFQVSFSDVAADVIVPGSRDALPELLDYHILSDVFVGADPKKERYSIHPLLQDYVTSKYYKEEQMQSLIKTTEEKYFSFFISEIRLISDKFFSESPGTALLTFTDDHSNFRKTLLNALYVPSLFDNFYEMIVSAADMFLFGFDDKLISSFFDYAAEDAKQRGDKPRYLALLFLQGDRGDVFFYHHKDKYNKIQKLVDTEVDMILNASITIDQQSTRETAYALCVQGRVLALYPSRAGWTKDADKVDNFEKGKSLVKDAVALLDTLNLKHDKAMVLSLLGLIYKNKRKYVEAIDTYNEALDIMKNLYGSHALIGAIHFNIGYMYYKLGKEDFLNGKNEFIKSYEIYEQTLGNHKRTASAVFHAGECLNFYGNLEESLPYFEEAFQIQDKVAPRDRDTAETLMSIAEVNYKLGNYQKAVPYYEKCLKIMTYKGVMSHPKHREIGYAYKGLANCFRELQQIDEAVKNYKIALDIFTFVYETHNRCKEEIHSINSTLTELAS